MLQAVPSAPGGSVVRGREKRFRYQAQDCHLTLRQGAAEYLQRHPGVLRADELSAKSAALFHSHDICHVIFGLDTTLRDEVLADCWTLFGTDVGLRRYLRHLRETPEAKELFRAIGYGKAVLWTVRALPHIVKVWLRSRRMSKKWPWVVPDPFWTRPLNALREDFNIHVV